MESKRLLANTVGQKLSQHLIAVANVSRQIIKHLSLDQNFFNLEFENYALLGGLFHDLGKVDPKFQEYINKSLEKNISDDFDGFHDDSILETRAAHHEISWALINSFDVFVKGKKIEKKYLKYVSFPVYWHHKKISREVEKFNNNAGILDSVKKEFPGLLQNLDQLIKELNEEWKKQFAEELDLQIIPCSLDDINERAIPNFKKYDKESYDFQENARTSLLRSVVISADRSISSIPEENSLDLFFKNKRVPSLISRIMVPRESEFNLLVDQITKGIADPKFNDVDRSRNQSETACKLNENKVSVLAGPPGCGKTRIALEWASLKKPTKIIWVCPRVNICQSNFQELSKEYLPNSNVEIQTGEFKILRNNRGQSIEGFDAFSGDIVITTIDQVLQRLTSNFKAKDLPVLLDSVFVFDEFHEFYSIPGTFFFFKELIYLLNHSASNFLLMSATPNPYLLQRLEIEGFDADSHIIKAKDFNQAKFTIKFSEYDEYPEAQPISNGIIISNNIAQAQLDYLFLLGSEKALLFHSSFNKQDKKEIYETLMNNFGKNKKNRFTCLRAGPIVQASLNISQDYLRTDFCSPENLIQRFGRCNRFGTSPYAVFEIMKLTDKQGSCVSYLRKVEFSYNISSEFYSFLKKKISTPITRQEISDYYYQFHKENESLYSKDFEYFYKEALKFVNIYRGMEPLKFITKKSKKKENKITSGFRGEGVYVLPVKASLVNNKIQLLEDYLYDPESDEIDPSELITMDPQQISECLSIFKLNAKKILPKSYNKYNSRDDFQIISRAKSPEFPIYTSYNSKDKETANILGNNEEFLVYIPYNNDITIGLITLKLVKKFNKENV